MKKIFGQAVLVFLMFMLFCGCTSGDGNSGEDTMSNQGDGCTVQEQEMFTERDMRDSYDVFESIPVALEGSVAYCDDASVEINGTTVVIGKEGTYILRGKLGDGRIVVDAGDSAKLQIVLDGADITSESSAALYVLSADKVFVTLADGSVNCLSNTGGFENSDENNIDGAVFSKADLTFNGTGSLEVSSVYGHGIVCKDDLVFVGGEYEINCASHGIDANDSVRMISSEITVSAGKDGIHAENNDDSEKGFVYIGGGLFRISSEGDGISSGSYVTVVEGDFDIVSGGGSENASEASSGSCGEFIGNTDRGGMHGGMCGSRRPENVRGTGGSYEDSEDSTSVKGIKASSAVTLNGGAFRIYSADDCIHSDGSVYIGGGTFEISSGDDGIHADENLTVGNGKITVSGSYEGLEGLHVVISGGNITIIADDDGINAAGGTDSRGFGGLRGGETISGDSSGGSVEISGGEIYVRASGDGIDSNGSLLVSGGNTTVCGPTDGDTSVLDYDSIAVITGGTFTGTGSARMAQTFSETNQGVIAVSVGRRSAGTVTILKDGNGSTIMSCEPALPYEIVIFSSAGISSCEEYTVYVGSDSGVVSAQ